MGLCFPPPATVLHLTLSSSARIMDILWSASTTEPKVLLCAAAAELAGYLSGGVAVGQRVVLRRRKR